MRSILGFLVALSALFCVNAQAELEGSYECRLDGGGLWRVKTFRMRVEGKDDDTVVWINGRRTGVIPHVGLTTPLFPGLKLNPGPWPEIMSKTAEVSVTNQEYSIPYHPKGIRLDYFCEPI